VNSSVKVNSSRWEECMDLFLLTRYNHVIVMFCRVELELLGRGELGMNDCIRVRSRSLTSIGRAINSSIRVHSIGEEM
jgi:hypothetical protein